MLVRILRNDGYYDYVKPQILDRLIEKEEIISFYGTRGLVVLGVDPVRRTENKAYAGDERRLAA
jgi:hypothetical protein